MYVCMCMYVLFATLKIKYMDIHCGEVSLSDFDRHLLSQPMMAVQFRYLVLLSSIKPDEFVRKFITSQYEVASNLSMLFLFVFLQM